MRYVDEQTKSVGANLGAIWCWEPVVMLGRFAMRSFSYTLRPSTAAVSAAFGVDALKQLAA